MDKYTSRRTNTHTHSDGRTDGRMDGWTYGRLTENHTDKQTNKHTYIQKPDAQIELIMSFSLLLPFLAADISQQTFIRSNGRTNAHDLWKHDTVQLHNVTENVQKIRRLMAMIFHASIVQMTKFCTRKN